MLIWIDGLTENNFQEKKMLTEEGKRKHVTSFTIHESLYKIIRTLQRTIYIQKIKTMYAARFATIGESQTIVKKTRKLN